MKTMKSKLSLMVVTAVLASGLLFNISVQAEAHDDSQVTITQHVNATQAANAIQHFAKPPFDYYKVSAHDTLYYIGKRYGVSLPTLFRLNPGIDPYRLQPGQIIKLRNTSAQPPATTQPTPARPSKPTIPQNTAPTATQFEQQVFHLVNEERAKAGLSPLRWDNELAAMAKDKAIDMYVNNYFDHISPTYGSPFEMMTSYGISYSYAGENIARGQRTPAEVMNAWMNSPGHRANILNANFDAIGVAYYNGEWVQVFIRAK